MAQGKIADQSFMYDFIQKSRAWLESFEGDEQEAGI